MRSKKTRSSTKGISLFGTNGNLQFLGLRKGSGRVQKHSRPRVGSTDANVFGPDPRVQLDQVHGRTDPTGWGIGTRRPLAVSI